MPAGRWPIVIEQGAHWERTLTVRDNGVLRPLIGYTARMQVRKKASVKPFTKPPLLELTTENGRIVLTSPGVIVLVIDTELGNTLLFTEAFYDLELVPPDGKVDRLVEGPFTVKPEVTE